MANHENTIFTAGVLFPDGRAIDLVRRHHLLYWDGERVDVREEFGIGGLKFRAVNIDGHLEQVLRIPAAVVANSTTDGLAEALIDVYKPLGFDTGNAVLAAGGTLTTWVPECLPGGAPLLNFWGAPGSEGAVLQVMTALARRPLHVVDASAAKIAPLLAGVYPTVIVLRPKSHQLATLVNVARGAQVMCAGKVVTVLCSVIAFTEQPLPGALNISLTLATSRAARLLASEVEELATRFQPRMLAYRLRHHVTIARSTCPVEEFAPEIKVLARVLAATAPSTPELQARILEQLKTLDEQMKVASSALPAAIVIEALLVSCREGPAKAFISDVSELANGILLGRRELPTLTPKAVGRIVHNLGLFARREGAGYVLGLDNATKDRIRELGRAHGVLSDLQTSSQCSQSSSVFNGS